MSMTDPIGDMLTRIRNAQMRGRETVIAPASKMRSKVLEVLQEEGYIRGYTEISHNHGKANLEIKLKYSEEKPVIREIKRISKPGRRVYSSVKNLPVIYNGLGISIISTPMGIMSDARARENNVGGEVLCTIF